MVQRQFVICEGMLKDICAYWCKERERYEVSIFVGKKEDKKASISKSSRKFSSESEAQNDETNIEKWAFYARRDEFERIKETFNTLQKNYTDGGIELYNSLSLVTTIGKDARVAFIGTGGKWLFYKENEAKLHLFDVPVKEVFYHYIVNLS